MTRSRVNIVMMHSKFTPSANHLEALRAVPGVGELAVVWSEEEAVEAIEAAEVVVGHRYLRQSLPKAGRVRWVQSTAGGVDRLPLEQLRSKRITLTNNTTASPVIARHAVAMAWGLTRQLPLALERQRAGRWDNLFDWPPFPRRAMVLGLGTIGREIARLLGRDGIAVTGVGRTPRPAGGELAERIVSMESWRVHLPDVDWVFNALPARRHLKHVFDKETLRAMKRTAVFINVGRGDAVCNEDLMTVLDEGHLAGVGLDVVNPKPGGPDDPLWRAPRLLVTPHIAAHAVEAAEAFERFLEAQVTRFVAGEPLANVIDLEDPELFQACPRTTS